MLSQLPLTALLFCFVSECKRLCHDLNTQVNGSSPWRRGVYVGFMADEVATGWVYSKYFGFSNSISPPIPHTHSSITNADHVRNTQHCLIKHFSLSTIKIYPLIHLTS